MSIHIKPAGSDSIVVELRAYDAEDADAAFTARSDYHASAVAVICPSSNTATIEAAHGVLSSGDVIDACNKLRERYGVIRCQWERANGKLVKLRWDSKRFRWVSDTFMVLEE